MVSSAVFSVLYLRDAAGEHTETPFGFVCLPRKISKLPRIGSDNVFALQAKQETTTLQQCQKHVTDHVAMPSLQPKKLGLTTSAKLSMESLTLIRHIREMVCPLTEHESKELCRQYCRPGGPLSGQQGESMKQFVSRRRRCWTLLVQIEPVILLCEGHRFDS